MKAAVFLKTQDGTSRTLDGNRITLDGPSVVQLQIGPEEIARFERDGNDLLLILKVGTVSVIENFFVKVAGKRNDLVFGDEDGVTWWAHYGDDWMGFGLAEINDDVMLAPHPLTSAEGSGLYFFPIRPAGSSPGEDTDVSRSRPAQDQQIRWIPYRPTRFDRGDIRQDK